MNVLVTGSEGIVGQSIVVAIADRWPAARIARVSRHRMPDVRAVDLRERWQVKDLLLSETFDIVIHAAATPYAPTEARPLDVLAHDLQMTANVLDAARLGGVAHVVLLSSTMVLDLSRVAQPSPIAIAKRASEDLIAAWSRQTGGTHTIWRLFNVVSPAERHDRPGHVCVDLYRRLFVDRASELRLAGDGDQLRCYSWVGDVADAIAGYLTDDRARGHVFSLGSDDPRSVRQLAQALLDAGRRLGILSLDYDPPIVASGQATARDVLARVTDVSRTKWQLGWAPATSFEACVELFLRGKHDVS